MRPLMMTCGLVVLIGLTGAAMPHRAEVQYFPAGDVQAAFSKGAVLLKQDNYMIHTSRRTTPGMGEIHDDDTDLIYVIEGKATFVTGGKLVNPKTTGPGEVRGTGIEGGTTRVISPGDVIVVPHGTPHWFREVEGTILYYTVKVR